MPVREVRYAWWTPRMQGSGRASLCRGERCHERVELLCVQVRHRPVFQSIAPPGHEVVAVPRGLARRRGASWLRPFIDIEHVLPPCIDDHRYRAPADIVHTPAHQREANGVEIRYRWRDIHAAVEPWLDVVLIRGR